MKYQINFNFIEANIGDPNHDMQVRIFPASNLILVSWRTKIQATESLYCYERAKYEAFYKYNNKKIYHKGTMRNKKQKNGNYTCIPHQKEQPCMREAARIVLRAFFENKWYSCLNKCK